MLSSFKAEEMQPSQSSPAGCCRDAQPGDAEVRSLLLPEAQSQVKTPMPLAKVTTEQFASWIMRQWQEEQVCTPLRCVSSSWYFLYLRRGKSGLLALMYQESWSKLYFPLWRFQWCRLSAKSSAILDTWQSCLFSQSFFLWCLCQYSSTKKHRTSEQRSCSLLFAYVLHLIS